MRAFFLSILGGFGRLLFLALEGLGHGVGQALRLAAPWALGIGALWYVNKYQPQLFAGLLAIAIMAFGLKVIVTGAFGKKGKKKK